MSVNQSGNLGRKTGSVKFKYKSNEKKIEPGQFRMEKSLPKNVINHENDMFFDVLLFIQRASSGQGTASDRIVETKAGVRRRSYPAIEGTDGLGLLLLPQTSGCRPQSFR